MRQFFKITWLKMAVILIVFLSAFPILTYDNGIRCIRAPCPNEETGTFLQYFNSQPHYIYSLDYTILILGLIVSYIVSCIIALLIEKTLKEKI